MRAPGAGALPVLAIAAAAGAGTMSVELSAVRLLAPWFGTSMVVWTNVIGVILLALALGYLMGARLSARPRPLVKLGLLLGCAALTSAWLPALAGPVCGWFIPRGVPLHEAASLFTWGSLAASLVLFLPAALLLGTASPLAVEAVQTATGAHAGTAGGQVLAASTLGSLAGTFATSHLLLPGLGLRSSFLLLAGLLAAAGLAALLLGRARAAAVGGGAVLLAGLGLSAWLGGMALPEPEGSRVLAQGESAYQWVRVLETENYGPRGETMRQLQVNEGLDSYQSLWKAEPGLLGTGEFYYYDPFALPAWWARAEGPWRVLVLGLGGGTALRVIEGASPPGLEPSFTGVELDPLVVAFGAEHLDLEPDAPNRRILDDLDARVALQALPGPFEQIVLDVYANQFEVPPHLSTVEFFRELRERLAPGGWLAANAGGFGFDDPVVAALANTCAAGFESPVLVLRVPGSRNYVLFARRDAPLPIPGGPEWSAEGAVPAVLLPRLELAGAWRLVEPGGSPVLTDDWNPIEKLQLRSLAEGRARARGEP